MCSSDLGAANVANNIASLGGTPFLVGVVGEDDGGALLRQTVERQGFPTDGLVADPARPTTVKTRVIAHAQHVVRIDREVRNDIPLETQGMVLAAIRRIARVASGLAEMDPSARAVAFLRRELDSAGILPSISRSLRLLQHHVPVIAAAWGSMIPVRASLPSGSWPLHVTLASIYLHAAIEDGQEEVDQLRQ